MAIFVIADCKRHGKRGNKKGGMKGKFAEARKQKMCAKLCGSEIDKTERKMCAKDGNTYPICEFCNMDVGFAHFGMCKEEGDVKGQKKAIMMEKLCNNVCGENSTSSAGKRRIMGDDEVCADDDNTYTVCELCEAEAKFVHLGKCGDKKPKPGKGGMKKLTKEKKKARMCNRACKGKRKVKVKREVCADDGQTYLLCDICDIDVYSVHRGKCGVCTEENVCPWTSEGYWKGKKNTMTKNKKKGKGNCIVDCDFQMENCKQFRDTATIKECGNDMEESEM